MRCSNAARLESDGCDTDLLSIFLIFCSRYIGLVNEVMVLIFLCSKESRKKKKLTDGKLMTCTLCYAFVRTKVEFHCDERLTNPAPLQRGGGSLARRRLATS